MLAAAAYDAPEELSISLPDRNGGIERWQKIYSFPNDLESRIRYCKLHVPLQYEQCGKSNFFVTVYESSSQKETVISFRGTVGATPRDWEQNINLLEANWYYRIADLITKEIIEKERGNFVVTGHSLGGALAMRAGWTHGLSFYAFNPGRPEVSDTFRRAVNQKIYRVYDTTTGTREAIWSAVDFLGVSENRKDNDFYTVGYSRDIDGESSSHRFKLALFLHRIQSVVEAFEDILKLNRSLSSMISYSYSSYVNQAVDLKGTYCGSKIRGKSGREIIRFADGRFSTTAGVASFGVPFHVALISQASKNVYTTSDGRKIEFMPLFCGNKFVSWGLVIAYDLTNDGRYIIDKLAEGHRYLGFVKTMNLNFTNDTLTIKYNYSSTMNGSPKSARAFSYQYKGGSFFLIENR